MVNKTDDLELLIVGNCYVHNCCVLVITDLATYTESILSYIRFCIESVTVDKSIHVFPNNKPWMTGHVRMLLWARDSAFRSGDRELYSAARADLKRGVREAKAAHKRKIESHFSDNNPRQVW